MAYRTALKKSERHKWQTKLCSKPVEIPYGCWNCHHFLSFRMPTRCLLTAYELSLSRGVSAYRFTLNLFSRSATYIFQHFCNVKIKLVIFLTCWPSKIKWTLLYFCMVYQVKPVLWIKTPLPENCFYHRKCTFLWAMGIVE